MVVGDGSALWLVEVKDVNQVVRGGRGKYRQGRPSINTRAHKQLLLNASSMCATPIYVVRLNKRDGQKEMRYMSANKVSKIVKRSGGRLITPSLANTEKFDFRKFKGGR